MSKVLKRLLKILLYPIYLLETGIFIIWLILQIIKGIIDYRDEERAKRGKKHEKKNH